MKRLERMWQCEEVDNQISKFFCMGFELPLWSMSYIGSKLEPSPRPISIGCLSYRYMSYLCGILTYWYGWTSYLYGSLRYHCERTSYICWGPNLSQWENKLFIGSLSYCCRRKIYLCWNLDLSLWRPKPLLWEDELSMFRSSYSYTSYLCGGQAQKEEGGIIENLHCLCGAKQLELLPWRTSHLCCRSRKKGQRRNYWKIFHGFMWSQKAWVIILESRLSLLSIEQKKGWGPNHWVFIELHGYALRLNQSNTILTQAHEVKVFFFFVIQKYFHYIFKIS